MMLRRCFNAFAKWWKIKIPLKLAIYTSLDMVSVFHDIHFAANVQQEISKKMEMMYCW